MRPSACLALSALLVVHAMSKAATAFSSSNNGNPSPPFQLTRLDHVVLRCRNYSAMFTFYTEILGCTIDGPKDVGRFGGALTHLRAGDAMIDLLSYDEDGLTNEGVKAVLKMHGGGEGATEGKSLRDVASFETNKSTMDHLCIRADPFNVREIIAFMEAKGIDVIGSGQRYGSEGTGPSIYVKDPEGNVVELKGPPAKE